MPRIKYHSFDSYAADTLRRFKSDIPGCVAIDTECTGLKWLDRPFGVSVAWQMRGITHSGWFELDDPDAARYCAEFFDLIEYYGTGQIYFNAKFDIRMLINIGMMKGWPEEPWQDMLIPAAYRLPSGQRGLKDAAKKFLNWDNNEEQVLTRVRKELKLDKHDYFNIPREYIIPYAETDARMTLALWHYFSGFGWFDTWKIQYKKEKKITKILTEMEFQGLGIIKEQLKAEIKKSDGIIGSTKLIIQTHVGMPVGNKTVSRKDPETGKYKSVPLEFNPGSHVQVKKWVFDTYGIKLPNIQAKTLRLHTDRILVLTPIMMLKKEEKLRNTYLVPILKELDEFGILHPNWNQFGTDTGRFSSSEKSDY